MSDSSKQLGDIPVGHYHRVMETGHPVRQAWHRLKFTRVLEVLPSGQGHSLIDIGCFAGSLLSLADQTQFSRQLGVDILPDQIAFANEAFGSPHREFKAIGALSELKAMSGSFDCATCVEVIEHLKPEEIRELFLGAAKLLEPDGAFVLSTPNYTSAWPVLELILNRVSDVDYSEQHITKFNFFDVRKKLRKIVPELDTYFRFDLVTTTHLLSPFMAVAGVDTAMKAGSVVPHEKWHFPFGALILMRLLRTDAAW